MEAKQAKPKKLLLEKHEKIYTNASFATYFLSLETELII